MKQLKNKQGFTLIELLAIIVVLAIVLLMGAMAIIPRLNDARKQVFALEANTAIQAATTYFMNNALNPSADAPTFPVGDNEKKCVTVEKLIESGNFKADKDKYSGYVIVTKKANSSGYLYTINMTNETLMVVGAGLNADKNDNKDVTSTDVKDYTSSFSATCPS